MKALLSDTKAIYRHAAAFAVACPLLFLIPVVVEMVQHVVELRGGMYVDEAGATAAEVDPLRLQFGFIKTLALYLPGYWFVRYVMLGDPARAARIEWPAFGLWLVVFAFGAVQMWWGLFGPDTADLLDVEGQAATAVAVGTAILSFVVQIYLMVWSVGWAIGNRAMTPLRSLAIMHKGFWHAVGLTLTGMLPLMVVHYGLAIAAVVVLPPALDWAAMVLDSIVVGYLALTLTGSSVFAALHAACPQATLPPRGAPRLRRVRTLDSVTHWPIGPQRSPPGGHPSETVGEGIPAFLMSSLDGETRFWRPCASSRPRAGHDAGAHPPSLSTDSPVTEPRLRHGQT